MFEIDKLREIIDENELSMHWINELGSVRDSIPVSERKRGKRLPLIGKLFSREELQPPKDMDFFSSLEQQYKNIRGLVCADVEEKISVLEHEDIAEKDKQISFLETLEDRITHAKNYLNFSDIMTLLDLSESGKFLKQYMDVLENMSADFDDKGQFERGLYDCLVCGRDYVFYLVEQEIQEQKEYFKTRKDRLLDIERRYRESLSETYKKFIDVTVTEILTDFANFKIVEPWNQIYGHEILLPKLVMVKETEEREVNSAGSSVSDGGLLTVPKQNIDSLNGLILKDFVKETEDRFREHSVNYVKDYASQYLAKKLREHLEIICRKKEELFEIRCGMEDDLRYWEELKDEICS